MRYFLDDTDGHACPLHLLAAFLLANVLTGAVNMTLPTMDATAPFAAAVLVAYVAVVCAVAAALPGRGEARERVD